jgi:hypothetical protein
VAKALAKAAAKVAARNLALQKARNLVALTIMAAVAVLVGAVASLGVQIHTRV